MTSSQFAVLISTLLTVINLGILAMMVKLYTEVFKDKAFDKRAKSPLPEERV